MTFSLCMIVRDEEKILERCLDSFIRDGELFDEIVIVDTGSVDSTKSIAKKYTDKIYDFTWVDDFSKARNFAFSKCTCDYIYSCDADEVLDQKNYNRFLDLKQSLLPEIEIVQMVYVEKEEHRTVLNFDSELRAKLYKRLRTFTWTDPIHETVRLEPFVYDSDIKIQHLPASSHQNRDFSIFEKAFDRGERFSKKVYYMYATELFKRGDAEDYKRAIPIFLDRIKMPLDEDSFNIACCVLARAYRLNDNDSLFFKYAIKVIAGGGCSDICYELGLYYSALQDKAEADLWFTNARNHTYPLIDKQTTISPLMPEDDDLA